jgi:hypothetical protein
MQASSMYSKLAKTAAVAVSATLAVTALMVSTAHARPYYVQDVQYVQVAPQLIITPPQVVIQAPVYQAPVYVAPPVRYARPVVIAPVVAPVLVPTYAPVYGARYVQGRIYYINGRPYLNGYPYVRGHAYGHYKVKHHKRNHGHHDRDERFDHH